MIEMGSIRRTGRSESTKQVLKQSMRKVVDYYGANKHLMPETLKLAVSGAFVGMAVAGIGNEVFDMHNASFGKIAVYVGSAAVIGAVGVGGAAFKELQRRERKD